ncbi:4Fe-4S dicluster domain-containing protein [Ekhidna sp.]|uniref:4Fe-4S binding protein n=1 Tax=Ekhidna sp. TaxID=2608089 RepID=UPI003298F23A
MKAIRYTGLILFLFSLGLFLGSFFMSSFTLKEDTFSSIVKTEHQESLKPAFQEVFGIEYASSVPFVNTINGIVEDANVRARIEQKWDQVIYDDYAGSLARASATGFVPDNKLLVFILIYVVGAIGALMFLLPQIKLHGPPGIKNNHIFHNALNNRGWMGILTGVLLIGFYILLYFYPAYITNWIIIVDPLQKLINPSASSSQWFLYGFLYTFAVLVMGVRMILKYRHSRYQIFRTCSVMFFQLAFAFLIPEILVRLNQPYFDFKNMWPLDYDFFDAWHINTLTQSGGLGIFMFVWGVTLFAIGVPLFVYIFGKRWYCSWVCGCGGLAETAGDPFRQLSDKSTEAWQIERLIIHGVLIFALIMTGLVLYNFFGGDFYISFSKWIVMSVVALLGAGLYFYHRKKYPSMSGKKVRNTVIAISGFFALGIIFSEISVFAKYMPVDGNNFSFSSVNIRTVYGFMIGSIFSGVVGTGFYPLMGNRVWCRFGCPLAAYLGLVQRFKSRFRITTNGGQCISCGNCSTYCEMGIDVRAYAQKGQNIVRSSCVGCGVCSAVCPRGVLNLENRDEDGRFNQPILIGNDSI